LFEKHLGWLQPRLWTEPTPVSYDYRGLPSRKKTANSPHKKRFPQEDSKKVQDNEEPCFAVGRAG
jgi:hypothetical protein